MSSRSSKKYLERIGKTFTFQERTAVGQWIRKLQRKEATMEQVPENIRNMIHVEKPAEVAVEEAADVAMATEHVHGENCHHHHDQTPDRMHHLEEDKAQAERNEQLAQALEDGSVV